MKTRAAAREPYDRDHDSDRERTIPRRRHSGPGHPSAWARAPRIEAIDARRREPGVALRILAEPALIDDAFRRNLPDWSAFDAVVIDILLGRR